jgi:hypothetical protein
VSEAEKSAARSSLADAFLRVDRAGEHLADLQFRVDAFAESQKDKLTVELHEEGPVIRNEGDDPPRVFSVIVGEVIYNLRAALDYLVYALAWLDSRTHQAKTQFPIEDTPEGFRGRRKTYLKGVSDEHVAAIQRLQPCDGCDWTAILRDISNQDKHWALEIVVSETSGFIDFAWPKDKTPADAFAAGEMHVNNAPTIDVAFPEGPLVVEALEALKTEVRAVLDAFEPEFEGG